MASPFSVSADDSKIEALRADIIGRRQPISVIARINRETERSVYSSIKRYGISYIKVGSDRYIDPVEYAEKRALRHECAPGLSAPLPPPRAVGRPRKHSQ
jgi:hypothetical protein